jgi:hypothetical protein
MKRFSRNTLRGNWAFLVLAAFAVQADELHVAPGGSDENPGTASAPLATIQAAVNRLEPGDTCLVHAGVYRETVVFPRSGTSPWQPITVQAYGDGKVVVSGCDPLAGWTLVSNRIWKATMPWTLGLGRNQVFSNDRVLIEARYPNAPAPGLEVPVSGLSPLWPTYGEFSIPQETRTNQPGRIVSKLLDGQPPDYWKGALYCGVHFEGWCAQTGVIESYKPGEISVVDRTEGWWFGADAGYTPEHEAGRGMIVGHMHALDAPGEWVWQDNALFLIAPDGGEPRAVEAKRRQLAFDLSGRSYIRIKDLSVRAASMRLENAEHCTVDNCDLTYISHYTRHYGIGKIEHGRDTIRSGETGIYVSGRDNAFLNCSVRFSAGTGFHLRGYHHTIHNCLIDEVSYVGHYLNAITDAVDDYPEYENKLVGGHVITFNTMRNAGRHFFNFYGNGPSLGSRDRGPMDYAATLFSGNHLYNGMLLTRDAGFITSFYASGGTLNGRHSQVAYNVMHDCYDIAAMRWNILGMVYLDNGSREVDVHHNLLWAVPGSLQCGIWFNPPNINVSDHDNVFHGLFTRTCADLREDDFPNGEPFRFGHDFDHPPAVPSWPQLETTTFEAESCVLLSEGVTKDTFAVRGLRDGDWIYAGTTDFSHGWQSAVLRLACDVKAMNTDRRSQGTQPPRHQKTTDPIVLDTRALDGSSGASKNWTVQRLAPGGWLRFDRVPMGDGYRRFRAVYGTTGASPRSLEIRLDQTNGLLVGTVQLPVTDRPRRGSIQMFEEAVVALSDAAKGTHNVYLIGRSDDGKPVAEFEYFRFEQARTPVPLAPNDFRVELRVGGRDGEKLGEFIPRFTGGPATFDDFVAKLEPAQGVQPLFLVVCSTLPEAVGAIDSLQLQRAMPVDWSDIALPPRRAWLGTGRMILPEASNRPCASPADHFREPVKDRPFFRATRLTSAPVIDGDLREWTGRVLELKQTLEGAVLETNAVQTWVGSDAEALYVAFRVPARSPAALRTKGYLWGQTDGVEIALRDMSAAEPGPILSLHGWADGHFCAPDQAGAPEALRASLEALVTYRSAVGANAWTCEWRIPFAACGLKTAPVALDANFTARLADENAWRTWKIASGATYDLNNGGTLVLFSNVATLTGSLRNGLAVWLDAADTARVERGADGAVSVWKDKSGNGRDAAQSRAEWRPRYVGDALNGHPALRFDDARRTRLELADLADRPIDATVIAVISNPEQGQPNNQHQRIFTASDGKAHDYLCGISCNLAGAETGGPRTLTFEGKGRWAKCVRVGCFSPNDQTYFHGDISEILVYTRQLTTEEKNRIAAYLMSKWEL